MQSIIIPTHSIIREILTMSEKNIVSVSHSVETVSHLEKHIKLTKNYSTNLMINLENANAPPEKLFFSVFEIIIFLICFDYYFNNQDEIDKSGYVFISISTINRYRNITRTNTKLEENYAKAFSSLADKWLYIEIDLDECKKTYIASWGKERLHETLIEFEEIRNGKKLEGFKFKFKELFDFILQSKQLTYIPISLMHTRASKINRILISLLLESYLRINYSKLRFSVKLRTIMRNTPYFSDTSNISKMSLFDRVSVKDVSAYKIFEHFIADLKYVLDTLKEEDNKLINYEITNTSIRDFDKSDSLVILLINKNDVNCCIENVD